MKFEKLGNIVNIKKGKKPIFTENPTPDSIRVLQIDDLRNDDNLKFTDEKKGVFASKEDVLLVWDGANAGTIGHGKEGFIGSTIALLSKKEPEKYSTTFIGLFLQSKFDYLRSKTTGATIPHIDGKVLRDLLIPLPSLETQLHIANILSKAESLIVQRKESIRLLDEYLKSVFLEMFGDPIKNPKEFPVKFLKDFYINAKDGTKCGPFGSALKKHEYTLDGIPVWNMDNISIDGHFIPKVNLFIDGQKYSELLQYSTLEGDIIISRAGTVGKMCVLNSGYKEAIISTNLIRVRLDSSILLPTHFVSLMNYCKGRMVRLRTGSDDTFTHMNTGILDSLRFPYPPLELQTKFASIVEKTEALKAQYQQSLQELENLYGSLSQKAFKGELSIKDENLLMAAEPETKYQAKLKPLKPTSVDYYRRMVLAAEIVWQLQNEPTLGHLKLQKLIYLCQRSAEMQLPTNFLKQAMGPYDPQMMRSIDKQLKLKEWFQYNNSEFLKYVPLRNAGQHQDDFIKYFSEEQSSIQYIIDTFKTKKSDVIEITATLYACLDEMYMKNIIYSEPMLLKMFYDYSERKKNFPEHDVKQVFKAMQLKGIVPKTFKN